MQNANRIESVFDRNAGRIVIAAASARALAASSLHAGRPVSTIDLFADSDTSAICQQSNRYLCSGQAPNFAARCKSMDEIVARVEQLFGDPEFQEQAEPPTILIGGGLENCFRNHTSSQMLMKQIGVVDETARWTKLNEFCLQSAIRFPATSRKLNAQQTENQWLIKTNFSSGGLGVQFAQPNSLLGADQYFQKYVAGQAISACYVAAPVVDGREFEGAEMLGVCKPVSSLVSEVHGRAPDQPSPFRYSGSVGPVDLSSLSQATLAEFKRVGSLVANHFGIAGVFGIDFVIEQERLWLLEINPRITASAELIEYAARETMPEFSIVQLHLDALSGQADRQAASIAAGHSCHRSERIFAKQIVYRQHKAMQRLRVTQSHIKEIQSHFGGLLWGSQLPPALGEAYITDVPEPDTEIEVGYPILTLHVSGKSETELNQVLTHAFGLLETILGERLAGQYGASNKETPGR